MNSLIYFFAQSATRSFKYSFICDNWLNTGVQWNAVDLHSSLNKIRKDCSLCNLTPLFLFFSLQVNQLFAAVIQCQATRVCRSRRSVDLFYIKHKSSSVLSPFSFFCLHFFSTWHTIIIFKFVFKQTVKIN